jgi:NADH:ubiquinone reductase (H+-translocating)
MLPGMAAVAKQQGVYVGKLIKARLRAIKRVKPFRYRDLGQLAVIGRKAAVIDLGWIHLRGFLAWMIWGGVHIYFLIGARNRIMVALQWLWVYFTFQHGARLITELRL